MALDRTNNILLVEDDEVDVMNVRRALQNNTANSLFVASNGQEALAMLGQHPAYSSRVPSDRRLILLDLNLPQMGGIEFLQALRADPILRPTPVVVLTTSNREQDRVDAYNLNVAGYLLKPITFSALAELLDTLSHYWMLCEMP